MKDDSTFNSALAGIYCTAVAFSALIISLSASVVYAADPPVPRGNVSANVNPTTGYYSVTNSTLRLPNGVSVSPAAGASTVTKYSGGLQQTIPTGITIDAIKKSAPLPAVVRAKTQSVKNAAKGFLGSPKANLAFLAGSLGLEALLDGVGWIMEEGSRVNKLSPPTSGVSDMNTTSNRPANEGGVNPFTVWVNPNGGVNFCYMSYPPNFYFSYYTIGSNWRVGCNYSRVYTPIPVAPVPQSEIDSVVDSDYNPDPTDWRSLAPHLDLDDVEITSAPTLQGEPKTTTVYDADGNPHKVTETNIWYDFDIRDNPSPRPALDMKTREETKTYEDGELTGTTTTESTASGGSGSSPESPPESPIDCDLFPTACAWFDWTQEEPTEPDDDLTGLLQEVPIVSETYTITGGVAACPAPMVLDLSVFGSREVSYQPLCDLASTMKFLYLALMSFAAAVLLNRSINRV